MPKSVYAILIVIACFLLVGGGITVGWKYQESQKEDAVSQLNERLMEAKLDLGKAKTEFGDASKQIDKLSKELREQIKANKEHVVAYGTLLAKYNATAHGSGTTVIVTGDPTTKFQKGVMYKGLSETELAPIEYFEGSYIDHRIEISHIVSSQPGQDDFGSEFEYKLDMQIGGQLINTTTKSGAISYYLQLYELDNEGKKIQNLELEEFSVTVEDLRKKEFQFVTHLAVGIGAVGGLNNLTGFFITPAASLELSFFGYGLTPNDLDFRFLTLGVDVLNNGVGLFLAPVHYNLGQQLPLVSNMWIGPKIGIGYPNPYVSGYVGLSLSVVM